MSTRVLCFHRSQSELEPIDTHESFDMGVDANWPIHIKDKRQMLVGFSGFFVQCERDISLVEWDQLCFFFLLQIVHDLVWNTPIGVNFYNKIKFQFLHSGQNRHLETRDQRWTTVSSSASPFFDWAPQKCRTSKMERSIKWKNKHLCYSPL